MDIWDPKFCELLKIPVPEDVVSLVLENELQREKPEQASGMHTPPTCFPPQSSQESSANSRTPLKGDANAGQSFANNRVRVFVMKQPATKCSRFLIC